MKKTITMLILLCIAAFAQQKGTFTDSRDGKKYGTIKIGTQTWMSENLNYAGKNDDIGSCYDKDPKNCEKYGTLYNWETAKSACPKGWHLPSNDEWQTLVDFAGGKIAGKKLKSRSGWNSSKEKPGNGTDIYGFAALPGGNGSSGGYFHNVGNSGIWWSATENGADYAHSLRMDMYYGKDGTVWDYGVKDSGTQTSLQSVRCVMD